MAFGITAYKNRTRDYTITLYESDGTTGVSLAASDVVRAKVYRRDGATPSMDVDSVGASANGSVVTVDSLPAPAQCTLRLAQGDLSGLDPGVYRCEVDVVDDSETAPVDAIKHVETGVMWLFPTGGGDIAKT